MTLGEDERVDLLQAVGLTEAQARAYAALMRLERGTAREVSERSGIPRSRVYDVLRTLGRRGLLKSEGDAYVAQPIGPVVDALRSEAWKRRHELAARREYLAREYAPAPAEFDPHQIRLLRGGVRPSDVLREAFAGATRSVEASFSVATLSRLLATPGAGDEFLQAVGRLPKSRLVVHASAGEFERIGSLSPRLLLTARIAPADGWYFDRIVTDREQLVLRFSLSADASAAGGSPELVLATRQPGLVADAAAVVAHSWTRGQLALRALADARVLRERPRAPPRRSAAAGAAPGGGA